MRLLVVLPEPLKVYLAKGEIRARYYNPGDLFEEVHLISFCGEGEVSHLEKQVFPLLGRTCADEG